jgi:hypothetical protein
MTAKDIVESLVTRQIVPMRITPCLERDAPPIHTSVSRTTRRKRALGRELRDIVFRLCSAAGVTLGLVWDLHHPKSAQRPFSTACSGHTAHRIAASQVGHCVGNELSSALAHWLLPIGVGLGIGVITGVLLASMIRLGRGDGRTRALQSRRR